MIKRILYLIIIATMASACTEEIEVELDTTFTRLVVDGAIGNDTAAYRIKLSTTAGYFSNSPAPVVSGATLFLSDGEQIYPLSETNPGISGIYETPPDFAGSVGKEYRLTIELAEPIGGESVYEASSALKPVTSIDSIKAKFRPEWGPEGIWTVQLWAKEPGDQENYYLFNLYRNGILLTDTITKKVVADDRFVNGQYMNGFDVIYLNNANAWETIRPGDTITLQMSGITREYYQFVNQIRQSGFSIPFFSGPPANVEGNISDGGVGFFTAMSDTYKTTVVK